MGGAYEVVAKRERELVDPLHVVDENQRRTDHAKRTMRGLENPQRLKRSRFLPIVAEEQRRPPGRLRQQPALPAARIAHNDSSRDVPRCSGSDDLTKFGQLVPPAHERTHLPKRTTSSKMPKRAEWSLLINGADHGAFSSARSFVAATSSTTPTDSNSTSSRSLHAAEAAAPVRSTATIEPWTSRAADSQNVSSG